MKKFIGPILLVAVALTVYLYGNTPVDLGRLANFARLSVTVSNFVSGSENFATNQNQIQPDFSIPMQLMATNNAANGVTLLAPIGLDTTKKVMQTHSFYFRNAAAAAILISPPANARPVPATGMYVTNLSRFTIECYPNEFTNVFCVPVY